MSAIRPAPLPRHYADIDVIAGRPVERKRYEAKVHRPSPLPARLHEVGSDRHRKNMGGSAQEDAGRRRGARTQGRADAQGQVGDFVIALVCAAIAILAVIGWPIPY